MPQRWSVELPTVFENGADGSNASDQNNENRTMSWITLNSFRATGNKEWGGSISDWNYSDFIVKSTAQLNIRSL